MEGFRRHLALLVLGRSRPLVVPRFGPGSTEQARIDQANNRLGSLARRGALARVPLEFLHRLGSADTAEIVVMKLSREPVHPSTARLLSIRL